MSVALELLQTWIPKRSTTALDVASNLIGIGLGMAVFLIANNLRKNPSN